MAHLIAAPASAAGPFPPALGRSIGVTLTRQRVRRLAQPQPQPQAAGRTFAWVLDVSFGLGDTPPIS
jgi:hypothetical protein